jgi:hypothetical protein
VAAPFHYAYKLENSEGRDGQSGAVMTPMFASDVLIRRSRSVGLALALTVLVATAAPSWADEGGVGFWVPGFFGSMSAAPLEPGWSIAAIYYHADASESGNAALSKQITIGRFNPTINVSINANVRGTGDIGFLIPQYVFETKIFGGQAALGFAEAYGREQVSLNSTFTAGPIPLTRTIALSDTTTGFSDFIPQFSLRWNFGVNNVMTYITAAAPIGTYSAADLANLGTGHSALDGGVGYTYLDPKAGHEFSVVSGLTGNFTNPHTGYTNGIDWHTDLAASQFVTKQGQLGVVGYLYQQITPDQGAAPILGNFEARVAGIGPQIGYLFPVGKLEGYVNLKAYWEFAAQNRPEGWNAWLTLSLSPAAPEAASHPPMVTK